jgi:hypothetical protein
MKLVEDYRNNKQFFKKYLSRLDTDSYLIWDQISEYSATTHIPIICLYIYYGEINGFDDFLINKIKNLCFFYDYNFRELNI